MSACVYMSSYVCAFVYKFYSHMCLFLCLYDCMSNCEGKFVCMSFYLYMRVSICLFVIVFVRVNIILFYYIQIHACSLNICVCEEGWVMCAIKGLGMCDAASNMPVLKTNAEPSWNIKQMSVWKL